MYGVLTATVTNDSVPVCHLIALNSCSIKFNARYEDLAAAPSASVNAQMLPAKLRKKSENGSTCCKPQKRDYGDCCIRSP